MFAGFTSRWTRPPACAASSACGDLVDDGRRLAGLEPALVRDQLAQVGIRDVPHRDEELAVLLARVVDRQDVGLIEPGGGPRLALEALAEIGVVRVLGRDQLERDDAAERQVGGAVDHAHPAPPGDFLDSVPGELRATGKVCHSPLCISDAQPRSMPARLASPIFRDRASPTGSAIAVQARSPRSSMAMPAANRPKNPKISPISTCCPTRTVSPGAGPRSPAAHRVAPGLGRVERVLGDEDLPVQGDVGEAEVVGERDEVPIGVANLALERAPVEVRALGVALRPPVDRPLRARVEVDGHLPGHFELLERAEDIGERAEVLVAAREDQDRAHDREQGDHARDPVPGAPRADLAAVHRRHRLGRRWGIGGEPPRRGWGRRRRWWLGRGRSGHLKRFEGI